MAVMAEALEAVAAPAAVATAVLWMVAVATAAGGVTGKFGKFGKLCKRRVPSGVVSGFRGCHSLRPSAKQFGTVVSKAVSVGVVPVMAVEVMTSVAMPAVAKVVLLMAAAAVVVAAKLIAESS